MIFKSTIELVYKFLTNYDYLRSVSVYDKLSRYLLYIT